MKNQTEDTTLLDVIKLEMQCVRNNCIMTAAEKNSKITELKTLAPKCSEWQGLDEPVIARKISFFETYNY